MDESEAALKRQFVGGPTYAVQPKAIRELIDSPESQRDTAQYRRKVVEKITDQVHTCRFARIHVKRDKAKLTLEWKTRLAPDALKLQVSGILRVIDFVPNPDDLTMGMIVSQDGDGQTTLQLEEGGCYSFLFHFFYGEDPLAKPTVDNFDFIHFTIGIPLSSESKTLLAKALKLSQNPEERIKDDLDIILKKQDAFDERLREGIEKIKAKGLPPDEEQRRIENFRDDAERVKERHGI